MRGLHIGESKVPALIAAIPELPGVIWSLIVVNCIGRMQCLCGFTTSNTFELRHPQDVRCLIPRQFSTQLSKMTFKCLVGKTPFSGFDTKMLPYLVRQVFVRY